MEFGMRNQKAHYFLNGERLLLSEAQRDLGVLMHESQKASRQVQQVVKKANGILTFIAKGLEFKNREVLLQLYRVLVRSHLECCVQFWSPYLKEEMVTLGAVRKEIHQANSWDERVVLSRETKYFGSI